jgi:hypothetical protein
MNTPPSTVITVKLSKSPNNNPYTVLFDGTNLDNWEHDSHFSIMDSAITGTGCYCMAFTKKDYGKYRFFVTVRVKSPIVGADRNGTGVMLGIQIWGKRHTGDYDPHGTIHIMPPLNWSWDYLHNTAVNYVSTVEKDPGFSMNAWNSIEILSDVVNGKFRMAANGVEVLNFTANVPSDWSVGPIGVLDHNGGTVVVQYKDIRIEENPTNFDLITLKP